jgi:hypothetical protein
MKNEDGRSAKERPIAIPMAADVASPKRRQGPARQRRRDAPRPKEQEKAHRRLQAPHRGAARYPVCAVAVTPANQPERVASATLLEQCGEIEELFIDRGYLGNQAIDERRRAGTAVHCKPFPLRNAGRFTKDDFDIDLTQGTVQCPNGIVVEAQPGQTAHFPASACAAWPKRAQCTRAL